MTIHCFAGPSLPDRPETNLGIRHLGPVRHGQLLNLDLAPGDVVAIIDGVFYTEPAVRHKEILQVLARGVAVVGGGSMGALRAAELHALGMAGLGRVFTWYASGEIDGDDEVALLHADEDAGYRPMSVALVSLRAACADLVAAGRLAPGPAATLLEQIKQQFFAQRTVPAIRSCAAGLGIAPHIVTELVRRIDGTEPDVKAADAWLVLAEAIRLHEARRTDPDATVPEGTGPGMISGNTDSVESWRRATAWQGFGSRTAVDQMVVQAVALCASDFPGFYAQATIRRMADTWGCAALPDAVAREFTRRTAIDAVDERLGTGWLDGAASTADTQGTVNTDETGRADDTAELVRLAVVTFRESPGRRSRKDILRALHEDPAQFATARELCLTAVRRNAQLAATALAEQRPELAPLSTVLEWVASLWRTSANEESVVRAGYTRGFDDLESITMAARPLLVLREDALLDRVRAVQLNPPPGDVAIGPAEDGSAGEDTALDTGAAGG